MAEKEEEKSGASEGGANEFEALFEESLRTVKPGGVVKGRVVGITSTHVLIDVGYKSEGQIPIHEFMDRQGNLQAKVGDDVDVYFDASEGDNGSIVLVAPTRGEHQSLGRNRAGVQRRPRHRRPYRRQG